MSTEPGSAHLETRRPGRRCPLCLGLGLGGLQNHGQGEPGPWRHSQRPTAAGGGAAAGEGNSCPTVMVETGPGSTSSLERRSWSLEERPMGVSTPASEAGLLAHFSAPTLLLAPLRPWHPLPSPAH